ERINDPVWIEGGSTGPTGEAARRLVGEVERSGQKYQVLQAVVGTQGGVHRADEGAQAPAKDAELGPAGHRLELTHDARKVFQGIVVELDVAIFRPRRAPIKQKDVVSALEHVLDEAMAGAQVKHMRTIHDGEHKQQRNALALRLRD